MLKYTPCSCMMQRLEVFHNQCVRGVLGVSRYQQWRNHISSEQLAVKFGMCNGISGLPSALAGSCSTDGR